MREELFNLTRKEYGVYEYSDTNRIKYDTDPVETSLFGEVMNNIRSTAPWGHFDLKHEHNSEEKFLEHYGNPFASVLMTRRIICVTKEGDKITFKMFWYHRRRRVASKWFKTNTQCRFLTFNYKTNSLYIGTIDNYHLKRKCRKRIRRASFNTDPINTLRSWIRTSFGDEDKKTIDVPTIVNQVVSIFVNLIPGTEIYPELLPEQKIYRRYLDAQGIKYPNNWFELADAYPQPKKKDLVKCGYKYIDALMKVHNLKGDKVKKILHNVKLFLDSSHFNLACDVFGEKFILNQPDEVIESFLTATTLSPLPRQLSSLNLSKSEKMNFFEIYKLYYKRLVDYHTIADHIRFYVLLRDLEPVKWKSRTHDEFTQEHYNWSEKYNHYTTGNFTRIYNPKVMDIVNEVILTKDVPYFPEVLLTSKRYNNESFFQSNCVKTYIKRIGSLLISLRRGEGETEERASIEYDIIPMVWPNEINFNLKRIQTLGKFNRSLDSSWDEALAKLDERIKFIVDEKIFDTLKLEVEFASKKIISDFQIKEYDRTGYKYDTNDFRDKGVYLDWENSSVNKLSSYNYNMVPFINDDELPI